MKIERRGCGEITLRDSEGQPPRIAGYASVFNQPTTIGFGRFAFKEVITPGAFRRALQENQDVRALVNHDPSQIVGRMTAGTLALREDDHGLAYEILPPDTQTGRDLVTLVKRGDITGSSFGFRVKTDNWRKVDGADYREILDVDLFDVSPVTFPAFAGTSAHIRAVGMDDDDDGAALRLALAHRQNIITLSAEDGDVVRSLRAALDGVRPQAPWIIGIEQRRRRLALAARA